MQQTPNLRGPFQRPELWGAVSFLALLTASQYAFAQDITPVPPVSVTAPPQQPNDGSAAAGYRVNDSSATGPVWGDLPLQDAPYSINVIPAQQIQNMQVYNLQDALKYDPDIQTLNNNHNDGTANQWQIRGYQLPGGGYGVGGVTLDGVQATTGVNPALEDKQQIEVLDGVQGFLYGVQSVGGNINLVLKRPTPIPYFAFEGGDNAGANGYLHLDMGGPVILPGIDESVFGYRLNLAGQDGDTNLKNQVLKRSLESGAIDIHLPDNLLVQFNVSHSNYHLWGPTQEFIGVTSSNGNHIALPALDPSTYVTKPQAFWVEDTIAAGTHINWKLNDIFTFRSEYQFTEENLFGNALPYYDITNQATGAMTVLGLGGEGQSHNYSHGGYAFLDTSFSAYGVNNKITSGFTGNINESTGGPQGSSTVTGTANVGSACNYYAINNCNISAITVTPAPQKYQLPPWYWNYTRNYMIGDEAKMFDDKLILLAGANYAETGEYAPGAYKGGALTPAVALVYKIFPWLSTYASFQQSLTGGGVVGPTDGNGHANTNAGTQIPPYTGTQYEAGIKATVGTNLLATLAVFQISQPYEYEQVNYDGTATEAIGGSQRDKGIELKLTGKITPDLTLAGGGTFMNPRITSEPGAPYQVGELPSYVSPLDAKLYAEYNIPYFSEAPWAHNFILTGGVNYTGPFHAQTPTQTSQVGIVKINGYSTGDIGFRYVTKIDEHPFTLRFTVTNFTNAAYWANWGTWGQPRTFLATAEIKW